MTPLCTLILLVLAVQDPTPKKPPGKFAKAAAPVGGQTGQAKRIEGGTTHDFQGIRFDLPKTWRPEKGEQGTELVPAGANKSGTLEEKYVLVHDPELESLDGEDADDSVTELAEAVQAGIEPAGKAQKSTFGDLEGRKWVFRGNGSGGRKIEIRVHGFRASKGMAALAVFGFADTLAARETDLAAILGSMRLPAPEAAPANEESAKPGPKEVPAAVATKRKPIPGATTRLFRGVSFDLPKDWSLQDSQGGTALVPAGANPQGVIEEAYVLIADPEHRKLDGPDVDARVDAAVQEIQPGVTRQGAVQRVAFGGVDGRLYVFQGKDLMGRKLEVRVHGFLGKGAACALVALGYTEALGRRAAQLQAILDSMDAPAPGAAVGAAEAMAALAGEWVYISNFNATNGGGSATATSLRLNADGTYAYHGQSSSTNPFGGAAGETRHSGTWTATEDSLTLVVNGGRETVYSLEKRNHPKNVNDPMIVLDGRAFVTATARAPWR